MLFAPFFRVVSITDHTTARLECAQEIPAGIFPRNVRVTEVEADVPGFEGNENSPEGLVPGPAPIPIPGSHS
jgi:hypothetical protein